jgi:GNAT superfamily N-acetyltransferase
LSFGGLDETADDTAASAQDSGQMTIDVVTQADLDDLLPLMRAYCDFYEVAPCDQELLALCSALLDDPRREGVQLLARDDSGRAVGFATIFWSWSTLSAARIAVMNDLYVDPAGRGGGYAEALIAACAEQAGTRGAVSVKWQTALDNHRAQAVYDRVGGRREKWLDYSLPAVERRAS